MKSPMVTNSDCINDKYSYSELKILQSAAGYYIGTEYWDDELKFWDRGSRDSDYFKTNEDAQKYLNMLNGMDEKQVAQFTRDLP